MAEQRLPGISLTNQKLLVSTPLKSCRAASYVNLATLRSSTVRCVITTANMKSNCLQNNTEGKTPNQKHCIPTPVFATTAFSVFDQTILSAAHQYAAVINPKSASPVSEYPLNLAVLAAAHNKSSSIADLRMKAKKHSESLGLTTEIVTK